MKVHRLMQLKVHHANVMVLDHLLIIIKLDLHSFLMHFLCKIIECWYWAQMLVLVHKQLCTHLKINFITLNIGSCSQ